MEIAARDGLLDRIPDFNYETDDEPEAETLPPGQQDLRVWLDRKQRAGKVVTLVKGGSWAAMPTSGAGAAAQIQVRRGRFGEGWRDHHPGRPPRPGRRDHHRSGYRCKKPVRNVRRVFARCRSPPLLFERAAAQYYTWGSDPPQKWSAIRTPDVRMIYPDTVSAAPGGRSATSVRSGPTSVTASATARCAFPFVMHPENFQSNGLVMYLPKRVEFLSSPAIDSYSMPWYKQLVAHDTAMPCSTTTSTGA